MRTTHLPERNQSLSLDPYRLDETTWTRAELLRLREADTPEPAARKAA